MTRGNDGRRTAAFREVEAEVGRANRSANEIGGETVVKRGERRGRRRGSRHNSSSLREGKAGREGGQKAEGERNKGEMETKGCCYQQAL